MDAGAWLRPGHHTYSTARALYFAEFAEKNACREIAPAQNFVQAFVSEWESQHAGQTKSAASRRKHAIDTACSINQMLLLAREGRVVRNRSRRPFPFESAAPGLIDYLREERGFKEATIGNYCRHLSEFAQYLDRVDVSSLRDLSPTLLGAYVIEHAPQLAPRSRRDFCAHLRGFLRFCHRENLTTRDLSGAVGMPQVYRLDDVPRSISWDEVGRMLEKVERRTIRGRRDYAILLLLVTYGLRANEIAKLTLDDVDWKRERLQVLERKAGHSAVYPLTGVVGEALIEYVRNGRPETKDRHLFFRAVAPTSPITAAAVSSSVAHYLLKAGIQVRRPGSHTLRHTCVQRLVDSGFPVKTIGDYVGHRSPESTRIYAKIAIDSLREVALGDGEEL